MAAIANCPDNVFEIQSRALKHLFTRIRDENTNCKDFAFYASRIMRIVAEESIGSLPSTPLDITCCGTGASFSGELVNEDNVCAVSIVRGGDSLLDAVRACSPAMAVGKILIQRDESTPEKLPKMFYSKLPPNVANMDVLLVDPMLATGGSAIMAIQSLVDAGVNPDRIIFANVVACPEGLTNLYNAFPTVKVVSACVDDGLNEAKYILPGLGDFGDRFFNTV
mmetsp:Transcript_74095/g.211549  ORF Transcript_74095/g.211549 Transcript_74095/m.211549 type:complete len:223 (+) Transcript_74095:78-746(+)|eukprot:CAMPEP_0119504308 /NCGR_PEP_ID=MMETSP1344-20130328/25212_1 /TAXON_ID=236787 /ORGANISM="Florenciella parvula, Strain CCMP2471" /LENGTH=222 /DNA_ID=CAMNT_0007540665 /DNA_START=56 /DNA_END=724 /DNA_ORIENTATION=-